MLTSIADALLRHDHKSYWDAPAHFRQRQPQSSAALERRLAEERHRQMHQTGLW